MGATEVQKLLHMNPVENSNLQGLSFIKRICGPTMLTGKELICVENLKLGISSPKKVAHKIAKKLELRSRLH